MCVCVVRGMGGGVVDVNISVDVGVVKSKWLQYVPFNQWPSHQVLTQEATGYQKGCGQQKNNLQ